MKIHREEVMDQKPTYVTRTRLTFSSTFRSIALFTGPRRLSDIFKISYETGINTDYPFDLYDTSGILISEYASWFNLLETLTVEEAVEFIKYLIEDYKNNCERLIQKLTGEKQFAENRNKKG